MVFRMSTAAKALTLGQMTMLFLYSNIATPQNYGHGFVQALRIKRSTGADSLAWRKAYETFQKKVLEKYQEVDGTRRHLISYGGIRTGRTLNRYHMQIYSDMPQRIEKQLPDVFSELFFTKPLAKMYPMKSFEDYSHGPAKSLEDLNAELEADFRTISKEINADWLEIRRDELVLHHKAFAAAAHKTVQKEHYEQYRSSLAEQRTELNPVVPAVAGATDLPPFEEVFEQKAASVDALFNNDPDNRMRQAIYEDAVQDLFEYGNQFWPLYAEYESNIREERSRLVREQQLLALLAISKEGNEFRGIKDPISEYVKKHLEDDVAGRNLRSLPAKKSKWRKTPSVTVSSPELLSMYAGA